jgi:hypothetical protein
MTVSSEANAALEAAQLVWAYATQLPGDNHTGDWVIPNDKFQALHDAITEYRAVPS